jgi:hypothetical protein
MTRFVLLAMLLACGPGEWRPPQMQDSHEDPAKIRPGFGNDAFHVWWPLSDAEVVVMQGADRARQGDAHALLAFAIMGSGDVRDEASYTRYTRRFDQFIDFERATIGAVADDSLRGDALNRAMHEAFFTGTRNAKDPKLGAYELDQARVSQIFEQGHYNCVSSALLYTTIARAFSLPVRGAITETHAFVDFGPEDGKRVDVETTTETGFGEVHDEKFYRDAAKDWSSSRGLRPMTFDEYKKREIVAPYLLVARAMNDKRIMIDDDTTSRLSEAAAILAPDDSLLVENRIIAYENEAKKLYELKASRTILRLIEVIAPFVSALPNRFPKDEKILEGVAWMAWYDASALEIVGRGDEAMSIVDDVIDHIDPTWKEAAVLQRNFTTVITDRLTELQVANDYEKSVAVAAKHARACHDDEACLNNLYLSFDAWDVKFQLAKDWPNAKKVMEQCIALLPDDTRCHHTLEGLTAAHP